MVQDGYGDTDKFLARHHSLRIHYEGPHNLHLTPPPIPHLAVIISSPYPILPVDENPNILDRLLSKLFFDHCYATRSRPH